MKLFNESKIEEPKKRRTAAFFLDVGVFVIGSLLYGISVDMFTAPNEIAPGGITGIATIINKMTDLPIGMLIIGFNVPLLIACFIFIGKRYTVKTLIYTVMSSLAIDLLAPFVKQLNLEYTSNPLLASVCGGVTSGLALGVAFIRGGSTGGTDIIARLLSKAFPSFTQGKLLLFADAVVIAIATYFFGIEPALYAIIVIFVSSKVIDGVLYGGDSGKLLFIITSQVEAVSTAITRDVDRGLTVLHGRGAFTGRDSDVLMCAVRQGEAYRVRTIVRESDPDAFVIVCDASEILGNGFKAINVNEFGEILDAEKKKIEKKIHKREARKKDVR